MDKSIQRNVHKDILKNRGLVRKRKKEDKNPRVKNRRKFEKALQRRKTSVKEFVAGNKKQKHGGEESGIRSDIIRG